jgi:acetyltransferase-like isoleucine patch superfamily enzyme
VRVAFRHVLLAGAVVLTAPLWLPWYLLPRAWGRVVFVTFSDLLSLVPGPPGVHVRRAFYYMTLEACGPDFSAGFGTTLAHPESRVGRGVYVGYRCTLGMVDLGDNVALGSNVDVLSGRHQHHFQSPDLPILEQGGTFRRVRIGTDSWVGNGAVVMADVGAGSIVGAGSVVVRAIPPMSVAAGNPAAVKRPRVPVRAESVRHANGAASCERP